MKMKSDALTLTVGALSTSLRRMVPITAPRGVADGDPRVVGTAVLDVLDLDPGGSSCTDISRREAERAQVDQILRCATATSRRSC